MFDPSKLSEMMKDFSNMTQGIDEKGASEKFSSKSGGGLVKVEINGNSEVLDINIDDSLLTDKTSLQILLISAINDAIKLAQEHKQNNAINLFSSLMPQSK